MSYWDVQDGLKCYVALDSIAERGRAMRTFVCIVPVTRRRVTTDNGERNDVLSTLVLCPLSRAEINIGLCFWDAECKECTDNCNQKLLIAVARDNGLFSPKLVSIYPRKPSVQEEPFILLQ